MSKVIFIKDISKLAGALDYFNIEIFSNKEVPFKLHMGEMGNKHYPKAEIVQPVIEELKKKKIKPYFYDTTVAYPGLRHSKVGYEKLAKIHGYNKISDVVIDDSGVNVNIEGRNFEVGQHLFDSQYIIAYTHVKGHIATGMGGTIKNFGMGGVTKETKRKMHRSSRPIYNKELCTYCGVCEKLCFFDAIKVTDKKWKFHNRKCFGCGVCVENCKQGALTNEDKNFQYLLACATKACIQGKNVIYINDVNRIAKKCDCDPLAGPIICPDVGYLISDDPVAIDKASLDLINKIKPNVFLIENKVDPIKQIEYGESLGIGSTKYELIEL